MRGRCLLLLVVLALTASACDYGTEGRGVVATWSASIQLTADNPVAESRLKASVSGIPDTGGYDVWLSLAKSGSEDPSDPVKVTLEDRSSGPSTVRPSSIDLGYANLTEVCRPPSCERSYAVVIQWLSPVPGRTRLVNLAATLGFGQMTFGGATVVPVRVSLTEDPPSR